MMRGATVLLLLSLSLAAYCGSVEQKLEDCSTREVFDSQSKSISYHFVKCYYVNRFDGSISLFFQEAYEWVKPSSILRSLFAICFIFCLFSVSHKDTWSSLQSIRIQLILLIFRAAFVVSLASWLRAVVKHNSPCECSENSWIQGRVVELGSHYGLPSLSTSCLAVFAFCLFDIQNFSYAMMSRAFATFIILFSNAIVVFSGFGSPAQALSGSIVGLFGHFLLTRITVSKWLLVSMLNLVCTCLAALFLKWRDGDSFDARPLFYDALHYFVWQIVALLSLFVYRSSFVWNVATKVSHKINQVDFDYFNGVALSPMNLGATEPLMSGTSGYSSEDSSIARSMKGQIYLMFFLFFLSSVAFTAISIGQYHINDWIH